MNEKRTTKLKATASCIGFFALFLAVLTVVSLIYVPKWRGLDAEEMRGLYAEEENSIDILCLGSCNMYSSFSPVIAYEQYGLTSYVYGCPDQELCISYHYLVEALKTQDIKAVVLETLFLTCEPTAKREYYNRTAVEYMLPSLNKAQLIFELGGMESEYMQTVDSSAPDKLLTYAGYFFPLLRYHGREDVTNKDIEFYYDRDDYSELKGGRPLWSYLQNENVDFAYVANGDKIRDTSREYFIKIQELCEKKGIPLVLVKSPNHYRWDEEATAAVTEFAAERGVTLLDFFNYDDFRVTDYSSTTGRLNIYGMKRFTEHLSEYLVNELGMKPHDLSPENKAKWDACVEALHATAEKKKMNIDAGQLYRVYNEVEGIRLLWNDAPGATTYSVYRKADKESAFKKVGTSEQSTFLDTSVEGGVGYRYYIVPEDGTLKDVQSNKKYFVFVDAPTAGQAYNLNGGIQLEWEASSTGTKYQIQRKSWDYLNYSNWDTVTGTKYTNMDVKNCVAFNYRIRASLTKDGDVYYSGALVLSAIPIKTPEIVSVKSNSGKNTVTWKSMQGGGDSTVEVYRRAENEKEFQLIKTLNGKETKFVDTEVESGVQYFYEIVFTKTNIGITGRSERSNTVGVYTTN